MDTIVFLPTIKIKPNDYNPNVVPDNIMRQLVKDVKREGVQNPVSVRKELDENDEEIYTIIDGEHRWRACSELGFETCPCVIKEKDKFDAMVETINMNRLRGEFDTVKLAQVLGALQEKYSVGEIEELLGYTGQELQSFSEMLSHDFGDFNEEDDLGSLKDVGNELESLTNTFEVSVSLKQLDIIETAIKVHPTQDRAAALTDICRKYLKETAPLEYEELEKRSENIGAIDRGEPLHTGDVVESEIEL